jgi:hypothetical protein
MTAQYDVQYNSAGALREGLMSDLEYLIDAYGLRAVTDTLGVICHEKADHIYYNWQDHFLAKEWTKAGKHFNRVSGYLQSLWVS